MSIFRLVPFLSLSFLSLAPASLAASREYTLVPGADGSTGVSFAIGYTAGTHTGRATKADGTATIDADALAVSRGSFTVPLDSIQTGNTTRDCHMREAMGLNYSVSRFPNQHVCSHDQLPAEGGDAIAYPTIRFDFTSLEPVRDGVANLHGTWTLHGVSKAMTFPVSYDFPSGKDGPLHLVSQFDLLLSDFDIIVKSVLDIITVKDRAKVSLNLTLAPR